MKKSGSTIVYVTRDIERALGMDPGPEYRILTNTGEYAKSIREKFPDFVTLVEPRGDGADAEPLDTLELLETPEASSLLRTPNSSLLVFKNTPQIEAFATKSGWHLLNPSAALAEKIENKVSQVSWLGELAQKYLPEHIVAPAKDLRFQKKPLVVQWAHGHTGDSTILVNSAAELKTLQDKFPEREARATEYVSGPSFTINVVAALDTVAMGNVSFQITGLPPFTNNAFATVGNDWSATHSFLSDSELASVEEMVQEIGGKLKADGWKGLFGLDFIRDDERARLCLIEVNARQPASTTFESILQRSFRDEGIPGLTIFEAHIQALRGEALAPSGPIISINDGAQVLQRVTPSVKSVPPEIMDSLKATGYNLIPYANPAMNADLLRIQSALGIMESPVKFNLRGQAIVEMLNILR